MKWLPVCTLAFYRFTLTGVLPISPAKLFQKIKPRYMRGVCVYHLNRCKTSTLQGAAGNVIVLQPTKTAMTFCDIDPGRWIDVPANFQKWEEAQPRTSTSFHVKFQFTALLSQSGINFGHLRLVQLHRNLLQFFAATTSPTVFLIFLDYFAETMSPMYLDYFVNTTSPIYNFWWRSWTWKPFRRTSIIRRMHR